MLLNTFAPPFKLVGGYFIVGILYLILSVFAFFMADFNELTSLKTAGFMHIYFVGFVISIIIGSLYQLTSVIIEKKFFSIKGAFINLFVYAISLLSLTYAMIYEDFRFLHAGGGALLVSLIFFGVTFFLSFVGSIKKSLASFALFVSSIYFLVGISLGFALVLMFAGGAILDFELVLKYHIYFVVGFMFFIVVAVATVLLPMFALSHDINFTASKFALFLYFISGFVLYFNLKFAVAVAFLSIICFVCQAFIILKKRVRKAHDYWNLNVLISIFSLIWAVVFYNFYSREIGIFFIMHGFFYAFIVGHIYKIAPFLIWYHYISPFVGKRKVPLLDEMIIKKVAYTAIGFNVLALAFYTFCTKCAMVFLFISIILVAVNLIHFFKFINYGERDER